MGARGLPLAVAADDISTDEGAGISSTLSGQSAPAAAPSKICIGCGARQSVDGSLPCGHDHDL